MMMIPVFSTSSPVQEPQSKECCYLAPSERSKMAYSNYAVPSGLRVHPVYVNRMDENGQIQQDRVWATVTQVGDHSYVHIRIDVDVLQPIFQGLHYGKQTTDELARRKWRRIATTKKEEAKEEQKKKKECDRLAQ